MLTKDEVISLSKSLFTVLKVEDCFIKTEFHQRYEKQLFRNMHQFNNLNRVLQIAEHHLDEYIRWNNQIVPEMQMTKYDYLIEVMTLLCNHGLATYEFLKRFFLETIDLELLNKKTESRLHRGSMLGTFVEAVAKLPSISSKITEDLFDVGFRNALAHDSWYLHDDAMRYVDPKTKNEVVFPYSQLHEKIQIIFGFYHVITEQYFETYFPEMVRAYKENIGEIMNFIFPMYTTTPRQDSSPQSSQS